MKLSLERLLRVRRREQPLLLLMMGTIGLFQFCQILNENFAATVFLKRYGVKYLPNIFFFNSLAFLALIVLFNRVVDRSARTRLVSQLLLLYAGVLAALRLFILSGHSLAYPVIYISVKQMKYLFFIVFWTLASDIYSTRKARRLFPIIGGGAVLGTISGSMLSGEIGRAVGTNNIILFSAAGMLFSYLLVGLGKRQVARLSPVSYSVSEGMSFASLGKFFKRELFGERGASLFNYLMLLALLPGILGPLFEYIFKFLANQTFRTEPSLLNFFGIYNGSFSLAVLICQLTLAGGIFRRYGIVNVLFAYPFGYLLGFIGLFFSFRMPTAVAGDASLEVIDASFYKPGCQMLYNIIPAGLRGRVNMLVQGAVRRLGELTGSGLLILLTVFLRPRGLTLIGPLLALLWVCCAYFLKRSYSAILYRSLSDKRVNFAELENRDLHSLITGQGVDLLRKGLRSGDAGAALMSSRLLSQLGVRGWAGDVCAALPAHGGEVQREMLRIVEDASPVEAAAVLQCASAMIHKSALPDLARIARRIAPKKAVGVFREGVGSGDPRLVAESMLGLAAAGGKMDLSWALSQLESGGICEVCSGIYLLGESGERGMLPRLEPFLKAPAAAVRAESALAAGKLGLDAESEHWVGLLDDDDPLVRLRAVQGLDALQSMDAVRPVVRLLGDEDGAVREAARRLIIRMGEGAAPILTEELPRSGLFARTALISILDRLGLKEQTLLSFIEEKVRDGYRAVAGMKSFQGLFCAGTGELIQLFFRNRLEESIYEIFRALGLLLKGDRMQFILDSYRDRDETVREHALEALENVLTPRLSRRLLPLLEDLPLEMKLAAGRSCYGVEEEDAALLLSGMLESGEAGERLCALMCIGEANDDKAVPLPARLRENYRREREKMKIRGGQAVEDLMEKVLTLKGIPLFSHLNFKELLAAASISREESFQAGDEIVRQGERGVSMYVIISGKVRILSPAGKGPVHLATLQANDYFGEMALFDDAPRSASAVAEGGVDALRIDKREFLDMLREYPGVSIRMCEEFCRRLRRTIQKVG